MPRTCQLSLYCPTMPIVHHLLAKVATTAAEPMVATLTPDDGTPPIVSPYPCIIPPTPVDEVVLPTHWRVRPCVGSCVGLEVDLPAQDCVFSATPKPCLIAKSITAPVTLTDAKGRVWKGSVTWPDSVVDLIPLQAEPVTATGTLTLQE